MASITNIPQTGRAVAEAYADPSIPNLTSAGVNALMTGFQPAKALGVLAAGYGAAAASDAGMFDWSASAAPNDRERRRAATAEAEAARARASEEAARARAESEIVRTRRAADDAALARQQQAQRDAEFDRATRSAESQRDAIRATDRQFKDSEVGKVYEQTGGFAPILMGMAGGLVHRLASGPSSSTLDRYVMPAAEGTALTFAGLNAPFIYNALSTPAMNPQRQALEVYSRELPEGHPRKAEARRQAEGMPAANPIQGQAWNELTSIPSQARRLGTALIEGAPAGIFGRNIPEATRNVVGSVGQIPGAIAEGYQKGMARADAVRAARGQITPPVAPALPPPAGPQAPPGGMPAPALAPPPAAPPVPLPAPPPAALPGPQQGRPGAYTAREKSLARPFIESEVSAGRNVPAIDAVENIVGRSLPQNFPLKLDSAQDFVEAMRRAGVPDDRIAVALRHAMESGMRGLPAVPLAAGGYNALMPPEYGAGY